MNVNSKMKIWDFVTKQSPRVLIALSALSGLFWFAWKDKISEWPLIVGVAIVVISFQIFNYLIVREERNANYP